MDEAVEQVVEGDVGAVRGKGRSRGRGRGRGRVYTAQQVPHKLEYDARYNFPTLDVPDTAVFPLNSLLPVSQAHT